MVVRSSVSRSVRPSVRSTIGSGGGAGGGGSTPLLLDTYAGAAAAFSLRHLRTAYAGNCIRVRRSSDSAEQDIGFSSGSIDTASLLTFCGAGNGLVVTWYDQSENGRNATQATTTKQPAIYTTGSVNLENAKPALVWSGAETLVSTFGATLAQPNEIYSVAKKTNIGYLYDGITGAARHAVLRGTPLSFFAGVAEVGTGITQGTQDLMTILFSGASSVARLNGVQTGSGNPGAQSLTGITTGALNGAASQFMTGTFQELIIYDADKSADRSGIESHIINYWGIS